MTDPDIEEIEADLLLEALRRRFGYDFNQYSRASLLRRLRSYATQAGHAYLSALIPPLLHDPKQLDRLINGISVTVTEPFRDPESFAAIVRHVFPWLHSYALAKIWVAGCSSGEEAYSLAILLSEAGLLERVQIYATDINTDSLARAKAGVYALDTVRRAEANYAKAGGKGRLTDHYASWHGRAKFAEHLSRPIVFTQHNLATDAAFGEMQFVMCRNVLIYFNRELQQRVVQLFRDSLWHRGYLALGARETLSMLKVGRRFEVVDHDARLFRAI